MFAKLNVIKCILIGFNALIFDYLGEAILTRDGFGIFPFFGVDGFHDARFENGVEMMSHLNEDVSALAVVLTIKVDGGMGGGAAIRRR